VRIVLDGEFLDRERFIPSDVDDVCLFGEHE
jgi:hypothetical protein